MGWCGLMPCERKDDLTFSTNRSLSERGNVERVSRPNPQRGESEICSLRPINGGVFTSVFSYF